MNRSRLLLLTCLCVLPAASSARADEVESVLRRALEQGRAIGELRARIEAGAHGDSRQAAERFQRARFGLLDEAKQEARRAIGATYGPGVELEFREVGARSFRSDVDLTVSARGLGDPVREVKASVEAVQAINRKFPHLARALDVNFYSELNEDRLPLSPSQRRVVAEFQDAVGLVGQRRQRDAASWAKYLQQHQERLIELAAGKAAELDQGDLRGKDEIRQRALRAADRLHQLFAAAELIERRLAQTTLEAKYAELLEALERRRPAPELLRHMAEVKLLEPDAYGARAAVRSVVQTQQAMARLAEPATYEEWRERGANDQVRHQKLAELQSRGQELTPRLLLAEVSQAAGEVSRITAILEKQRLTLLDVFSAAKSLVRVEHEMRRAFPLGQTLEPVVHQAEQLLGAKRREATVERTSQALEILAGRSYRQWIREAQAQADFLTSRLRAQRIWREAKFERQFELVQELEQRRRGDGTVRWGEVVRAEGFGLAHFGLGLFLKELLVVLETGRRDRLEEFFQAVLTTDFYLHYGAFVAGARGGQLLYGAAVERRLSERLQAGTMNRLLRQNVALAAGLALPQLLEGKLDGQGFALTFGALMLSSAAIEASLGRVEGLKRLREWNHPAAKLGRLARVGGFVYTAGELALVLYGAEKLERFAHGALAERQVQGQLEATLQRARDSLAVGDLEAYAAAWDQSRELSLVPLLERQRTLEGELEQAARRLQLQQSGREAAQAGGSALSRWAASQAAGPEAAQLDAVWDRFRRDRQALIEEVYGQERAQSYASELAALAELGELAEGRGDEAAGAWLSQRRGQLSSLARLEQELVVSFATAEAEQAAAPRAGVVGNLERSAVTPR